MPYNQNNNDLHASQNQGSVNNSNTNTYNNNDNSSTYAEGGSYELKDFSSVKKRKEKEELDRENKRLRQEEYEKYQRKRERDDRKFERKLEEAEDGMKFSHSIQFNAVPDWSSHYIAYSNLKKL